MDLNTFIQKRRPQWKRLEELLIAVDSRGLRGLSVVEARQFAQLYRDVSSDLVRARSLTANPELLEYINDLVARTYGHIYAPRRFSLASIFWFFVRDYPRLVRREFVAIALAAGIFFGGAAFGAGAMLLDPSAGAYLLPKQHLHLDPSERVKQLEGQMEKGEEMTADQQAYFSAYLFTHNIQVTFLAFVLGLTFSVGTLIVLFYNGLMIGALAVNYHADGVGLFFWAWILPHGVPELTSIFIAGGAGLILGRALWQPGRRSRAAALKLHAGRAVKLILGTAPVLVVAGLIEGSISQMHAPVMPYGVKLAFAGVMAVCLAVYFGLVGRTGPGGGAPGASSTGRGATSAGSGGSGGSEG